MADQMLKDLCEIQMKAKNLSQQIHSSMVNPPSTGNGQCPTQDLVNNYPQQGNSYQTYQQPQSSSQPSQCCPTTQPTSYTQQSQQQSQRKYNPCPSSQQQSQQQQQQQSQQQSPQQSQQQPYQCPPSQTSYQCPPPQTPSFQCPPPQDDNPQFECPEEENSIKVCEIDQSGSHIKIYNDGSKMEYISGYFIVQTQKDCCLSIYKIPPCVYLAGQSCLKIWTCPFQNNPNKLPSDLVFKELSRWKTGNDVLTTLYRCDGKPVSCLRGSFM